MQFLSHSTIVSPLTRIRRERLLPNDGDVIAKIGQEVSPVQVLARSPLKVTFEVVPVCQQLRISPEKLAELLAVQVGSMVEAGDVLVKKRGFGSKAYLSPVNGVLHSVVNGRLVFSQVAEFVELRALARSRVVNRIANRGVLLEINGSRIQAVWDSGKEGFGTVHVAGETAVTPFTADPINTELSDNVLVTGKITEAEPLEQAQRSGISGLIAGSITADLLPIAQAMNYPIFITGGIGEQGMSEPIFQLLQKSEARHIALFSSPPNLAGQRPEIIIPLEAVPGEDLPPAGQPLTAGQTVRILQKPYYNQVGIVTQLHQSKRIMETGSSVYGADVKLTDEQTVFVPIVNLDAII